MKIIRGKEERKEGRKKEYRIKIETDRDIEERVIFLFNYTVFCTHRSQHPCLDYSSLWDCLLTSPPPPAFACTFPWRGRRSGHQLGAANGGRGDPLIRPSTWEPRPEASAPAAASTCELVVTRYSQGNSPLNFFLDCFILVASKGEFADSPLFLRTRMWIVCGVSLYSTPVHFFCSDRTSTYVCCSYGYLQS